MRSKSTKSCPVSEELEPLLEAIRHRFAQLSDAKCQRNIFLKRLQTLTCFGAEAMDYEEPQVAELPKELEIGFAVCHPECGNQAFVVMDGGPQGCDCCGGTMMPMKTRVYRIKRQTG